MSHPVKTRSPRHNYCVIRTRVFWNDHFDEHMKSKAIIFIIRYDTIKIDLEFKLKNEKE